MLELCSTCLSKGRRLMPIKKMQSLISTDWLDIELNMDTDSICWECCKIISKINRFQSQVLMAQDLLSQYKDMFQPSTMQLCSLSRLNQTTKTGYDVEITYVEHVLDSPCKSLDEVKPEHCDKSNGGFEPFELKKEMDEDSEVFVELKSLNSSPDKEIGKRTINTEITKCSAKQKSKWRSRLSLDEQKFVIIKMTEEEMKETRDLDSIRPRYIVSSYKCKNCIIGYFTEGNFLKHMSKEHSKHGRNYRCPICQTYFKRPSFLEYHYDCHFRRYKCKQCDFAHHRLSTMLTHYKRDHEMKDKKYVCNKCNKTFDRRGSLLHHRMRFHNKHRTGDPTCGECGKTFTSDNSLRVHMKIHEGRVVKTKCKICGNKYQQTSIKAHMLTHNPIVDETAYCAECDIQFKTKSIYKSHLLLSAKHRQPETLKYKCSHCDFAFVSPVYCNRHINAVHLKNYPLKCQHCDRGFTRKDRLKEHIMERHEGISRPKNKICNFCGKAFKDTQVLKKHVRVHTGERPYQCEYCSASFKQRPALKTHVKALHPKIETQETESDT